MKNSGQPLRYRRGSEARRNAIKLLQSRECERAVAPAILSQPRKLNLNERRTSDFFTAPPLRARLSYVILDSIVVIEPRAVRVCEESGNSAEWAEHARPLQRLTTMLVRVGHARINILRD